VAPIDSMDRSSRRISCKRLVIKVFFCFLVSTSDSLSSKSSSKSSLLAFPNFSRYARTHFLVIAFIKRSLPNISCLRSCCSSNMGRDMKIWPPAFDQLCDLSDRNSASERVRFFCTLSKAITSQRSRSVFRVSNRVYFHPESFRTTGLLPDQVR